MKNKLLATLIVMFSLLTNANASAKLFNFGLIPWSDMVDNTEFTLDLCNCDIEDGGKGAGLRARLFEPIGVIETTNTPWNIVSLGAKLDKSAKRAQSVSRGDNAIETRRYSHNIAIAPLGLLNFVQDSVCFERITNASFLYWTEIIPSQTNDVLGLFTQLSKGPLSKAPYSVFPAFLPQPIDCAATTFGEPNNSLHWITGCVGVTGNNTAYGAGKEKDPITAHHVYAMSLIDDLHYAGVYSNLQRSAKFSYSPTSKIANSMCSPTYSGIIIKSQYELSLASPSAWDATKLGEFRGKWAEFKNKPHSEDDVMTWVWTYKDTCVGGSKCKSFYTKETN